MKLAIAVTLMVCAMVVDASIISHHMRTRLQARDAIERCRNKDKPVRHDAFGTEATTTEGQTAGPYQLPPNRLYICNFDDGPISAVGFKNGAASPDVPANFVHRFTHNLQQFFDGAKSYLWVIDRKNNLVIAPETQPGNTAWLGKKEKKKISHGDLTPGIQPFERPAGVDAGEDEKENRITGPFQGIARAGGLLKIIEEGGKKILLIDNKAGYSLTRVTSEQAQKITSWGDYSGPTQSLAFDNLRAVFCRLSQLAAAPLNGHRYMTEQQRGERINCPNLAAADATAEEMRVLFHSPAPASASATTAAAAPPPKKKF